MARTRSESDPVQQTVNLNAETHELVERMRALYERRLADQELPIKLSKAQVINMALKNEMARQEESHRRRPRSEPVDPDYDARSSSPNIASSGRS